MNHSVLIGFLGKAAEERISKNGKRGMFFSLAVDSYFNKEKKTQWYNIVVWEENMFNLVKPLKKGYLIGVAGTMLPPKIYQSKTGETRVDLTLKCSAIYFLPSNHPLPKEEDPADLGDMFG